MKFLFKLIVLPILILLFFPVLFLALTYKSVDIPYDEFSLPTQAATLTAMIEESFGTFLDDVNEDSVIALSITQKSANELIGEILREQNEHFALTTAPNDDLKDYVIKEEFFGYQGSWARFDDQTIEIESGIHVFISNFTFKTRLLLGFKLEIDTEEVVLTLDKVTLGNLPLAWTFGVASWIMERVTGDSISDLINNQLEGLATFDVSKREIRLDVDDLLEFAQEGNGEPDPLFEMLLKFIRENDLVQVGFTEEVFQAALALGKAYDPTVPFLLPQDLEIQNETHFQSIMAAKASSLVFSTLNVQSGQDPFIELDQLTLNRIFEYFLRDQQTSFRVLQEIDLYESLKMQLFVPYVELQDGFKLNLPLSIFDENDVTKRFDTIIKIASEPQIDGNDLKITLNELSMGQLALSSDEIGIIIDLLGETDFVEDGAFVIKDFDQEMGQAGINIKDVETINGKLRIYVELANQDLNDIIDVVGDVLDFINNAPEIPPAVSQAIDDVLNELQDPEGDVMEAVESLLDSLNDLDDQEQQDILDAILDAFEDLDYDYDDLFDFLP